MGNLIVLPKPKGVNINLLAELFMLFNSTDEPFRAAALIGVGRDLFTHFILSGRHTEKLLLIGALEIVRHQILTGDEGAINI